MKKPSEPSEPSVSEAAGVVTLQMVAREAGVSPSTVSRILNGTAPVSESRRSAVEDAIERLHFQPNAVARGLAQGRTMSIGVLTQDLRSPFYGEAHQGIEDVLSDTGFIPLFVSGHWTLRDEQSRLAHLLARRVDGIIVLSGQLPDEPLRDLGRRLPAVVVGRALEAPGVTSLRFDNFLGAVIATRHLIDLGHRRIAHIGGPPDFEDSRERLRGYRQALADAGIGFDPDLVVQADFHETGGLMAANRLLDAGRPFTALFAANDQSAFGARLALHRRGWRVPDDISLVGFDDVPAAAYGVPPLTTVRQPIHAMGRIAALTLLRSLRPDAALPGLVPGVPGVPPPELALRESTARPSDRPVPHRG